VRQFFTMEFEPLLKRRSDALEPILNKVGLLVALPELRNILGQSRSSFDAFSLMNRGQILLVRIPQGILGEDCSSLLGGLLVATFQQAAHRRVELRPEQRRPFYLYVDEFQNFATSSFARILSEARSFKLGLICANQYPEQLSQDLRLAVANNAATTVRCQQVDGRHFLKVQRLEDTVINRPPIVVVPPPPLPNGDPRVSARLRQLSRDRYGRPRETVEQEVAANVGSFRPPPQRTAAERVAPRWKRVDVDEE
jgi:hypothetical protein